MPTSYDFIEPHNTLSNSTIGKWVKAVLANAGIDMEQKLALHSKKYLRLEAAQMQNICYVLPSAY